MVDVVVVALEMLKVNKLETFFVEETLTTGESGKNKINVRNLGRENLWGGKWKVFLLSPVPGFRKKRMVISEREDEIVVATTMPRPSFYLFTQYRRRRKLKELSVVKIMAKS
jgi:hypothetical protein